MRGVTWKTAIPRVLCTWQKIRLFFKISWNKCTLFGETLARKKVSVIGTDFLAALKLNPRNFFPYVLNNGSRKMFYNYLWIFLMKKIFLKQNMQRMGKNVTQQLVIILSILYFTSICNAHLQIYNSCINNMFTHKLKLTVVN